MLENYGDSNSDSDELKLESQGNEIVQQDSASEDTLKRVSSWKRIVNEKGEVTVSE